jgi:cytidine diphosphoramidate kinase
LVIWLIGLSGAGKSTIGKALVGEWREIAPNTVLVDGDEVRELFQDSIGKSRYSIAARRKSAERMIRLCRWLDQQGMNVVCCTLSIFHDLQEANRENYSSYFEVFVKVPLEVVVREDVKGISDPLMLAVVYESCGMVASKGAPYAQAVSTSFPP